jgi:hypothetical protein
MNELFNFILKSGLTPNGLYVIQCIKDKIRCPLKTIADELILLQSGGWVSSKMNLTLKATEMLTESKSVFSQIQKDIYAGVLGDNAEQKIEEFRQMFPPGSPAKHGKPVRGTAHELAPRFIWFFNTYPDYDWDRVMAATKFYLQDQAMQNNTYLSQAKYFIQKQEKDMPGVFKSDLAAYCDDLEVDGQAA